MTSCFGKKKIKKFSVYYFIDSNDINWSNCYIEKAKQKLQKFMIKFFLVLIFLFVSSPAALLQYIQDIKFFARFPYDVNTEFGYFLKTFMPTLVVILINNLIMYVLYLLSQIISDF